MDNVLTLLIILGVILLLVGGFAAFILWIAPSRFTRWADQLQSRRRTTELKIQRLAEPSARVQQTLKPGVQLQSAEYKSTYQGALKHAQSAQKAQTQARTHLEKWSAPRPFPTQGQERFFLTASRAVASLGGSWLRLVRADRAVKSADRHVTEAQDKIRELEETPQRLQARRAELAERANGLQQTVDQEIQPGTTKNQWSAQLQTYFKNLDTWEAQRRQTAATDYEQHDRLALELDDLEGRLKKFEQNFEQEFKTAQALERDIQKAENRYHIWSQSLEAKGRRQAYEALATRTANTIQQARQMHAAWAFAPAEEAVSQIDAFVSLGTALLEMEPAVTYFEQNQAGSYYQEAMQELVNLHQDAFQRAQEVTQAELADKLAKHVAQARSEAAKIRKQHETTTDELAQRALQEKKRLAEEWQELRALALLEDDPLAQEVSALYAKGDVDAMKGDHSRLEELAQEAETLTQRIAATRQKLQARLQDIRTQLQHLETMAAPDRLDPVVAEWISLAPDADQIRSLNAQARSSLNLLGNAGTRPEAEKTLEQAQELVQESRDRYERLKKQHQSFEYQEKFIQEWIDLLKQKTGVDADTPIRDEKHPVVLVETQLKRAKTLKDPDQVAYTLEQSVKSARQLASQLPSQPDSGPDPRPDSRQE
jgi:chromosome segregation ATPase